MTDAAYKLCQAGESLAQRLPALITAAPPARLGWGSKGRRQAGAGESFWQFRRYQSGDSVPTIDWRQSARSQHLFVRERERTTTNTVWLWCDSRPAMDYRSRWASVSKGERARLLLVALGCLLFAAEERVGLWAGSPNVNTRPSTSYQLAAALLEHSESITDHNDLPTGEMLVLVSDYWEDTWPEQIAQLAKRFKGCLLRVLDPAERDFPFRGRILFTDQRGQDSVLLNGVETLRESYQQQRLAHQRRLVAVAEHWGWNYIEHHTDQPSHLGLTALYGALTVKSTR